ncbi:MAG: transcriptional repressor [Planctomycetes bacterium]|jgi:Fur family ferric uptake transcriptional regulator|nr:transcriptional repressor [Phycisphaerae bacterium]NBB95443.1 transcriptional repressor [Planctomycetota bacterium]
MTERNTRQKTAVATVLAEARTPLTPRDIQVRARTIVATISQATVYRILKGLLEKQDVTTVQLPGEPPLYEQAGKTHHHFFRCRRCKQMYEVQGCDNLIDRLVPKGFTLEDHDVFLFGLCRTCTGEQSA